MRLVIGLGVVAGCNGERATDDGDVDTDDTTIDDGCSTDGECGSGQICEATECVEGDRDNSFDLATRIYQEIPLDGEIAPKGDRDYYAYVSNGDEWLRVETSPDEVDGSLDTVVSIYDASGALHAWMDDYPTGNIGTYDTVLYAYIPTAGTWYVVVQDRGTFLNDPDIDERTGEYTLNVRRMGTVTDESDSIDDPSASVELANETTVYAVGVVLEEPGDSDWISLDVPWALGPIEIYGHTEIPGSKSTSLVKVHDPSTGAVILAKEDVGPDGRVYYFATQEQEYLVEATDAEGEGTANHWYVLYFRVRLPDYYGIEYDLEPNDSAEAAQTVPTETATTSSGTPYEYTNLSGFIDAEGDEDWFALDANADDYVTVLCSSDAFGSFLDFAIDVYDTDGTLLDTIESGTDSAPDVYNLGPVAGAGDVLVRVWSEDPEADVGPGAYYYCSAYLTEFLVSE